MGYSKNKIIKGCVTGALTSCLLYVTYTSILRVLKEDTLIIQNTGYSRFQLYPSLSICAQLDWQSHSASATPQVVKMLKGRNFISTIHDPQNFSELARVGEELRKKILGIHHTTIKG